MEFYIKRAKKGDIDAFINLMEMNKSSMYKTAKAILNNDEDVADAIQETILSCYKNISKLKNTKYFKTWMTRILINKCSDIIKANKNLIYSEHEDQEFYSQDIVQSLAFRESFESLKSDYKIIMTMHYEQGFNLKEISEILSLNESTVRTRMSRARELFKKHYLSIDMEG